MTRYLRWLAVIMMLYTSYVMASGRTRSSRKRGHPSQEQQAGPATEREGGSGVKRRGRGRPRIITTPVSPAPAAVLEGVFQNEGDTLPSGATSSMDFPGTEKKLNHD